jgi:hypothetical protein
MGLFRVVAEQHSRASAATWPAMTGGMAPARAGRTRLGHVTRSYGRVGPRTKVVAMRERGPA